MFWLRHDNLPPTFFSIPDRFSPTVVNTKNLEVFFLFWQGIDDFHFQHGQKLKLLTLNLICIKILHFMNCCILALDQKLY